MAERERFFFLILDGVKVAVFHNGSCRGDVDDISIYEEEVVEQGDDGTRAGLGYKHGKHTRCI